MIHFQDWEEDRLGLITAPAFFIVGDRDVMTTVHVAEMSRLVPRSRLMVLPATHGTYMTAGEHGNADTALIDFTILQVAQFLENRL